jgi:hypothetical protein
VFSKCFDVFIHFFYFHDNIKISNEVINEILYHSIRNWSKGNVRPGTTLEGTISAFASCNLRKTLGNRTPTKSVSDNKRPARYRLRPSWSPDDNQISVIISLSTNKGAVNTQFFFFFLMRLLYEASA